ncbi:hypothetical protein FNV43_RR09453 [Rhamnella rubrinervis]|uniref:5'-3' DNA helicase ZGRF1-like N-terminal domain-containing protein n=1 Tax=Rhamnella rubrinervis TaxID=2594499 RepID=A0A8K0HB90_9ROSA|nr:hypothetical protein FNV43_RR09453 [Rhamnella rubrinervis]
MGDLKRWSVTYTKHMKQKRKVYQDGFLEHCTSTNKLMLYDDSEKLLECRLLKKDEVVSCGETLTFSSHLIDVNFLEGDHKPPSASTFLGRESKIVEKNKSRPILSPSQKIIRDFKKREARKFTTTPIATSCDAIKSSTREWEVLYTTQVTQKAKKFHDGFLQLAIQGSFGRQILLFDSNRNLLDSRFLKKDEVIESEEAITFDAHLVEIGEPKGDHKILTESNCNVTKEAGNMHGEHSHAHVNKAVGKGFIKNEFHKVGSSHSSKNTTESCPTEWNVLYTTQLTQKAKKYHDGFLHLANCGFRGRQAMLYDPTRKLLESRFLKKEEIIKSGESFAFGTHLVDIGEPEVTNKPPVDLNVQGKSCNIFPITGEKHRQPEFLALNKGKPHNNYCLGKDADSNFIFPDVDKIKTSKLVSRDKPLRDVNQILSILQKSRVHISMAEGYSNNSMTKPASPSKEPSVSDDMENFPENDQPQRSALTHHEPNEIADTTESRETMEIMRTPDLSSSKVASTGSDSPFDMGADTGNSYQLYSDNMEADARKRDEAYGSNIPTSPALASYGPNDDDDRKSSVELTCAREIIEGPSFDLGF